jgi:hypothetical protein
VTRVDGVRQCPDAERLHVTAAVIVQVQPGGQRNDRPALGKPAQQPTDERAIVLRWRKAVIEVELHGDVRRGRNNGRRRRIGTQPAVARMTMDPLLVEMPPPVRVEQPVHRRWMQHRAVRNVGCEQAEQIVFEGEDPGLLLLAVDRDAFVVAPPELGRIEAVEDLAVAGGERLVPRSGAAA